MNNACAKRWRFDPLPSLCNAMDVQNLIKELGYRNAMDVEDVLTHPEENVVAQLLTDEELFESVIWNE
ncbi:hypothetical protein Tco_1155231 [Tanacetum coccineum]